MARPLESDLPVLITSLFVTMYHEHGEGLHRLFFFLFPPRHRQPSLNPPLHRKPLYFCDPLSPRGFAFALFETQLLRHRRRFKVLIPAGGSFNATAGCASTLLTENVGHFTVVDLVHGPSESPRAVDARQSFDMSVHRNDGKRGEKQKKQTARTVTRLHGMAKTVFVWSDEVVIEGVNFHKSARLTF